MIERLDHKQIPRVSGKLLKHRLEDVGVDVAGIFQLYVEELAPDDHSQQFGETYDTLPGEFRREEGVDVEAL